MLTEDEVRLLGLAAPQILKMLEAREVRLANAIHGNFKNGKHDQTVALAEWISVREQINEIKSVLQQHEKQEEKRHADTTR